MGVRPDGEGPALYRGDVDTPGRLSERMAAMARDLQQRQGDRAAAYRHVVEAACSIAGCDGAALSFVRRRRAIETAAATDDLAADGERLQHQAGEGPCLDAIWERQTVHSTDVAGDARWPTWGPQVARETGARSILVLRLYTHGDTLGALSLYSRDGAAFGDDAAEEGLALAAHVAVAVAAAQEIDHLTLGLDSRALVGQATGIVMERFGLDAGTAFAVLTRLSSSENVKLRVLAAEVVAGRVVGGS